jgi:hypothetical protein
MDVAPQAVSLTLSPDPAGATALVRSDPGRAMGADFQTVLEGLRQRSATVEAAGRDALGAPSSAPATASERSMRQLTDLYTYAVDMQVLVRTGGQLTSGVRQLITGQ